MGEKLMAEQGIDDRESEDIVLAGRGLGETDAFEQVESLREFPRHLTLPTWQHDPPRPRLN